MQKEPSSHPDKRTSLEEEGKTITSLEGSSSTQKESLQHPSGVSPPNTKDIKRYLVKKSRRGYLNTPSGITLSSYSREHPPRCQDDSFPLPRVKLPKHRRL